MTITNRLRLNALISVAIVLLVSLAFVFAFTMQKRAQERAAIADQIVKNGFELNSLTNRYLRTFEDRPREQWFSVFDSLWQELTTPPFTRPGHDILIGRMRQNLRNMRLLFEDLIASPGTPRLAARRELIANLILTRSADIYLEASRLSLISNRQAETINRTIRVLFPSAVVAALALAFWSARRIAESITEPIGRLRAGAEIAGTGDLGHRIRITSKDEIGDLSRAFDRMAEDLQNITVSKEELWTEIEDRKRTEEALRRSEERLRIAASAAEIGMWYWIPGTSSMEVTANWRRLFGIDTDVPVGFETWRTALHPDDRDRAVRELTRAGEEHREFNTEYRVVRPGGSVRWIVDLGKAWYDANGFAVGMAGVNVDITERKCAEEERERLLAELKRSNTELEQFAYAASHDLQEPLRTIINYLELLAQKYRGRLDEKADKFMYYAVDAAERMQKLIEGLLSYSRVTTRGTEFKQVDLNKVLMLALSNLSVTIGETQAEITRDDLPLVQGDESQLVQLFQNLIGNAVKYRRPGVRPRVHVSGRKENAGYVFSVTDNGIGIDPRFHERVFQIFQRLHTRNEYSGTGIGLALCKRIVERHQGRIWVESVPGRGSTFFFTVPAEQVVETALAA